MKTQEIIEKLKNKKWRKRGKWHHSVLFHEIFAGGETTKYSKKLGYPFKRTLGVWLPNGDYLDLEQEWLGIRKIVDEKYKSNPKYLENYANHCLKLGKKVIDFSKKIQSKKAKSLTKEELSIILKDLVEKCKEFMPFMFSLHLVDEFLTEKFDELLRELLKEKGKSKEDYFEYQTALALPFKKIFILEEQENLMKIAIESKKSSINNKKVIKLLTNHTQEHSWINASLFEEKPYTYGYFEKKVKELSSSNVEEEYDLMLKAEKNLKEKQKTYMKEIESHEEILNITNTLQKFGFLRSYRIDVNYMAIGNCWNIFEEITNRLGINVLDIKYLDSKEIHGALIGKLKDFKSLIEQRKKHLLSIIIENDRYEISDKSKIDKITSYIKLPKEKITDFVRGTVAYPGNISGACKVLHNLEDMKKVEKGDIIVVSMTNPNYIPAMEKASAFVTDFGGILCHAAIVSREMKKPCIIGTKIATKTFRDNDLLEIDSDKGIVKIIKKS